LVEPRASAPAGTLKLHLHRIAPLQGRVMRRARVGRAEKRKAAKTPRLVEPRASAPAGTLKLHLYRIAPLQGRVMRSRAEKRKAARTPRLVEPRASAPAATLKFHFRKARLQDRVPKNDEFDGHLSQTEGISVPSVRFSIYRHLNYQKKPRSRNWSMARHHLRLAVRLRYGDVNRRIK
jgi:hypothetical protein